jgi:hypothetical protein
MREIGHHEIQTAAKIRKRQDEKPNGGNRSKCHYLEATLLMIVLGSSLSFWSTAEAATCFASADEVRQAAPKAWPKWTYGPNHERCWYSGKKPVFTRSPAPQLPMRPAPVAQTKSENQTTSETPADQDTGGAESIVERLRSIRLPWDLEYRWNFR